MKLKTMQHELTCSRAVLQAKTSELEVCMNCDTYFLISSIFLHSSHFIERTSSGMLNLVTVKQDAKKLMKRRIVRPQEKTANQTGHIWGLTELRR
jgi:hypothetical protein